MTVSLAIRRQLEEANGRFYEAFESRDAAAMAVCWAASDDVACVHPGGPVIRGWEEVRDSWTGILAASGYVEVDVDIVGIVVNDPMAWVSCIEYVTTASGPERLSAAVAATNAFVLDRSGWLMVLHHASPVVRPVLS